MRLIDVESPGHPAKGDNSAALSTEAAVSSAETSTAFALRAIAKLLDPLLQIVFAPSAEVLRPPLRATDAH